MTASLSSLHKILKDETRRKILALINEKGSITYTDLLKALESESTGLLNYHLKVLGDLLQKNDGQYQLSEKGKLALKFTVEFSDDQTPRKVLGWPQQRFLIAILGVGEVAYYTIVLAFYFVGYIDLYRLATASSSVIIGTITLYFIWRMRQGTMPAPGSIQMQRRIMIGYIMGGAMIGLLVAFLGGGVFLRLISDAQGTRFGGHNPLYLLFWSPSYLAFSLLIAPALGAYIAYYLGKRRGFEQPKWAIWLDAHLG